MSHGKILTGVRTVAFRSSRHRIIPATTLVHAFFLFDARVAACHPVWQLGVAPGGAGPRPGIVARRHTIFLRLFPAAVLVLHALLSADVVLAAAFAGLGGYVAVRDGMLGDRGSSGCGGGGSTCSVEAPRHVEDGLVPAAVALATVVRVYSRIAAVDTVRPRRNVAVGLLAVETPRHAIRRLVPAAVELATVVRVYSRITAVDTVRPRLDVTVWLRVRRHGGLWDLPEEARRKAISRFVPAAVALAARFRRYPLVAAVDAV